MRVQGAGRARACLERALAGWAAALLMLFAGGPLALAQAAPEPAAQATPERAQATAVDLAALAAHPTWRRLLHMPLQAGPARSEVNTPDFFLAAGGREDALAELQATLAAFEQPWPDGPAAQQHPRCRFPGRYLWLSRQLALPGYDLREPRCARLQTWARLDDLRSASVFLVSGYFGNPASAFGHSLLRFNTGQGQRQGGKLDVSLNFGAAVPADENMLLYIVRGLTGGYQAGFSDQPFFTNDLMYGHTELRDMWEYELRLSPDELRLLVLHVAEVAGKSFDYYFLNRNCAQRLAELLELATGRPVIGSARGWYIPVEMFHALHRLDEADARAGAARLLNGPPRFIASAERVLWHEFDQLDGASQEAVNRVVGDGLVALPAALAGLPGPARLDVLDTLLSWKEYQLTGAEPPPAPELRREKDRLLLARLREPARQRQRSPLEPLPSPALGHAPMLVAGSWAQPLARDAADPPGHAQLRWALFDYGAGGFHGLGTNELVAMEGELGWRRGQGVRLERLDVIRVRKLNTRTALALGDAWSWQVRAGAERPWRGAGKTGPLRPLGEFAVGRAGRWAGAWGELNLGLMLGAGWRVGDGSATLGPVLVADWVRGDWRLSAQSARRLPVRDDAALSASSPARVSLTRRLGQDRAVQLRWQQREEARQVVAEWQQFW